MTRHVLRHQVFLSAGAQAPAVPVVADSRRLEPGSIFVATGARRAAHSADARARGAAVVISDDAPTPLGSNWRSPSARYTAARVSAVTHGIDQQCPPLLGVTGTDGKTTSAWYAWCCLGQAAARVGTLGLHDGTSERVGAHTTPPAEQLHGFLADLPTECPGVAVEVSSHAIDQHRLAGLRFAAMAFTGIGSDHLDYHRHHAAYVATKLRAARLLMPKGLAVINADDPRSGAIAHAVRAAGGRVLSLGFGAGAARLQPAPDGWRLCLDGDELALPVRQPGAFNAWNAAAGALLASAVGGDLAACCARLATAPAVPGRMELVLERPLAYVDYAHTPGAVAAAVAALREAHPRRRLVCVAGCGGDRDTGKRAPMGRAAVAADRAVLTSDNPRSEDPAAIVTAMCQDLGPAELERVDQVLDRGAALQLAYDLAGPTGVVLVCGKGHETVQVIGAERRPWDDRAALRAIGGVA
ncbi:MAG: UDP-N-acetylmuramyl-tripeptide synthetase [Planctomycetota bacterium]|jgi:UDP-N-acetylmuramoyl-L-alanyl-D-glutamate--2,6-diaminopimelate ligase|nr:UDP-N-acetylmuramyl-tripeptide synthetase [Planctomycetota bacterium]